MIAHGAKNSIQKQQKHLFAPWAIAPWNLINNSIKALFKLLTIPVRDWYFKSGSSSMNKIKPYISVT